MTFALVLAMSITGQSADSPASVSQAFALMNAERSRQGLPPYRPNVALGNAAEMQAATQARRGRMGHDGDGGHGARIRRAGYSGRAAAENVAAGQNTPSSVVDSWMSSPHHRAAILSRDYVDCGIACELGRNGSPFWCAVFARP